ncbi:MAG: sigma-70 family RNA polymerase sigma factor [Lachnospiraceae bacterium]|nr:sigma-70 family RNA polymerase sigma factor [Lachnospiraceae bacterium]
MCHRIKENDLSSETRLLLENEGLIVQIANMIKNRRNVNSSDGIDDADLIQEGRIAMLTAAKVYDEGKNAKFSTFAFEIIKNAMTDLCDHCQSTFERHMEAAGLTRLFLNDPDVTESTLYPRGTDVQWKDSTGDLAVLHIMLEKLHNRLVLLPAREQRILMYHFGISALEFKSVSETAAYFHLTEKYLKIIETGALKTLRDGMNDGKII